MSAFTGLYCAISKDIGDLISKLNGGNKYPICVVNVQAETMWVCVVQTLLQTLCRKIHHKSAKVVSHPVDSPPSVRKVFLCIE